MQCYKADGNMLCGSSITRRVSLNYCATTICKLSLSTGAHVAGTMCAQIPSVLPESVTAAVSAVCSCSMKSFSCTALHGC